MKPLQNRIDFCVIISVDGANPNGDPLVPGYQGYYMMVTEKYQMFVSKEK